MFRHRDQIIQRYLLTGLILLSTVAFGSVTAQAKCNPEEVGYVATFNVKPGSEAEFEAAISKLSETVLRLEPGAILYAPYKGVGGKYYMMERYKNEAARKVHATSDEVRALFPPLFATLAGQADVQPVSAICP